MLKDNTKSASKPLFPALACVIISSLFIMYVEVISWQNFSTVSDLPVFYTAARQILSGAPATLYDPIAFAEAQNSNFPKVAASGRQDFFYVPPYAIPWIVFIGFIPVSAALLIWKLLILASLIASFFVLKRAFSLDRIELLWLIAWVFLSSPAYETLRIDQISTFLLLAFTVAIFFIAKNRPAYAGLALAFMFLKTQEVLPILFMLAGLKKYKVIIFTIIWGALVAVISLMMLGIEPFQQYLPFMNSAISDNHMLQLNINSTLGGQLLRIFPQLYLRRPYLNIGLVSMTLSAFGMLTCYVIGHGFANKTNGTYLALAAALPTALVTVSYCQDYDLLLLIPCILVIWRNLDKMPHLSGLRLIAGLGILAFATPIYAEIHYNYLLKGAIINPMFWALLAYALSSIALILSNKRQLES